MNSITAIIIYILVDVVAILITVIADRYVNSCYNKYSKIPTLQNMTGKDVAQRILSMNQIDDVDVGMVSGKLSDHYSHKNRQLNLSPSIYNDTTIASIAVSAHEAGHALQYKQGYFPIKIRNIVIPITNFANRLFIPLVLIGALFSTFSVVFGGWFIIGTLILLALSVLLNLVTLPVEFDASRRAMQQLRENFNLSEEEIGGAKQMLTSAALTYVASMAVSVLYLLRFLLIFARNFWDN